MGVWSKKIEKYEIFESKILERKKKFFQNTFFLVAAVGLLYLDLKFEGNQRRSNHSQRNISNVKELTKNVPGVFEPQRIQSYKENPKMSPIPHRPWQANPADKIK